MPDIKREVLRLLREDEEFRYAVAGIIGLDEILKRFDKHDELFAGIFKRFDMHDKLFEEILKRLDRHQEILVKHEEELINLRKEVAKHGEILVKHEEELVNLRRELVKHGEILVKHEEELVNLRRELVKHGEILAKNGEILAKHGEELVSLREESAMLRKDMMEGFKLMDRHLSALGARWGVMAEESFREGLRAFLERELNLKVEKWTKFDGAGRVYGYPSIVEIDVSISDQKTTLIEIASHIKRSDVLLFMKKAGFYEESAGVKPDRLIMITPYAENEALEAAEKHKIEIYTKV